MFNLSPEDIIILSIYGTLVLEFLSAIVLSCLVYGIVVWTGLDKKF